MRHGPAPEATFFVPPHHVFHCQARKGWRYLPPLVRKDFPSS